METSYWLLRLVETTDHQSGVVLQRPCDRKRDGALCNLHVLFAIYCISMESDQCVELPTVVSAHTSQHGINTAQNMDLFGCCFGLAALQDITGTNSNHGSSGQHGSHWREPFTSTGSVREPLQIQPSAWQKQHGAVPFDVKSSSGILYTYSTVEIIEKSWENGTKCARKRRDKGQSDAEDCEKPVMWKNRVDCWCQRRRLVKIHIEPVESLKRSKIVSYWFIQWKLSN